jgi:1-acyl-sn-glycerol-3-phosphate acyltransferase
MIPLTKQIRRLSAATVRDAGKLRRLVVTLLPGDLIGIRPEGTRRTEYVSIGACHALGMRQRIQTERADKARAKKARKA